MFILNEAEILAKMYFDGSKFIIILQSEIDRNEKNTICNFSAASISKFQGANFQCKFSFKTTNHIRQLSELICKH